MDFVSGGLSAVSWERLGERYNSLSQELLNPSLDQKKRSELQREFSHLSELWLCIKKYKS